jgi:hypothetical protein
MVGIVPITEMNRMEISVFAEWTKILTMSAMISELNGTDTEKSIILMTTIKGGNSLPFSRFNTLKCGRPTMGVMAGILVLSSVLKFFARNRGLKCESAVSHNPGRGRLSRSDFPPGRPHMEFLYVESEC